jgi:acyl-CoA synthetase (AMP-forming)/AMP-acid ligase II
LERPIELVRLLDVGLKTKPNETALVSLERKWSWWQLDEASTQLAGQYLALGLVPGDRVASLMPNRGVLLVHYLACFKAGLAATPLNYRYQAPEIDHALEGSSASLLVAHAEREDVLAASTRVSGLPLGRIQYGAEGGRIASWKNSSPGAVRRPTCRRRGPIPPPLSFSRPAARASRKG